MPRVRAAGGVVWRVGKSDGGARRIEVALVHRPRYDDWSLPKGKLEKRESEFDAAVREVGEELGATVAMSRRLRRIAYRYGTGDEAVDKTVAFWLMRYVGGEFVPNDEVDEVAWLPPEDAAARLSHDVEREVLDEFGALPLPESHVVVVRHAKAGKRSEWHGDDAQRPLDATGVAQADRLVAFVSAFAPDRIVSAAPVRCVQTVTPLARRLGLEVVVDPRFSDDDYVTAPAEAEAGLLALAVPGRTAVVASQGTTIPGLVSALHPASAPAATKKGAVWVLGVVDGTVISADYYPDAGRA
ncbi:NUDIX hydrolase [Jatrophihabitans fulvus]